MELHALCSLCAPCGLTLIMKVKVKVEHEVGLCYDYGYLRPHGDTLQCSTSVKVKSNCTFSVFLFIGHLNFFFRTNICSSSILSAVFFFTLMYSGAFLLGIDMYLLRVHARKVASLSAKFLFLFIFLYIFI